MTIFMKLMKISFSFGRTNLSEEINVSKTSTSKKCDICHYWYFLDKGFKFQPYVWNGCHDELMMSMNLSDIAILNINGVNYPCIINGISKSEAVNITQKSNLTKKNWNIIKHIFFFIVYKR